MSKERLLQIINRLELSPRDKNDLVKEINTNTEKIEKLLENVPEDLDTLKEIINTPADFLNNNHELGGMIHMPFGYNNLNYKNILKYDYNGDGIVDVDCGRLKDYHYGKIIVTTNNNRNLIIYDIADITGSNNQKLIEGPIWFYFLNEHIYITTHKTTYIPLEINFAVFSNYNKLPLNFTTQYVVGNNTQEELDELKRLCSTSNSKRVSLMTIVTKQYGTLNLMNVSIGGPSNFWTFAGSNHLNIYTIQFPSKDISALEVRQYVEDIGAIVTLEKLNTTPDWNVNENENGYINNRTHYYKETEISIEILDSNKAIVKNGTPEEGSNFFKVKTIDYNFNVEYKIIDPRYYKDSIGDVDGLYSINISIENYKYVITGNVDNLDKFDIKFIPFTDIHRLPDAFVPDTIARTANYERPHIKLSLINTEHNLNTLSKTQGQCFVCDLFTSYNIPTGNNNWVIQNGEYFNGTITGIKEGKLVQYDVNFNTGEITLKQTTDLELIGSEVKLDVCTTGSTEAARNLELLNKAYFALGDHFTVNIDAGIGVAKFIPEAGGEGHITTAEGVNVHYTIGADGSVVKTMEIDIVALYNKVEAMSITE